MNFITRSERGYIFMNFKLMGSDFFAWVLSVETKDYAFI